MAGVEEVEAAVGEDDALRAAVGAAELEDGLFQGEDLSVQEVRSRSAKT
jgi:hypothetical protein